MNNNDDDFAALLELLKQNRAVIREIVFHPEKIPAVLDHKGAKKLLRSAPPAKRFLKYMAKTDDGYPVAFCWAETQSLCGKGTLMCVGGTKPPPL